MVCDACANALHADCENVQKGTEGERATWCDCQHRQSVIHTNSVVNRDQSKYRKASEGNSKTEAETTEESKDQG